MSLQVRISNFGRSEDLVSSSWNAQKSNSEDTIYSLNISVFFQWNLISYKPANNFCILWAQFSINWLSSSFHIRFTFIKNQPLEIRNTFIIWVHERKYHLGTISDPLDFFSYNFSQILQLFNVCYTPLSGQNSSLFRISTYTSQQMLD